MRFDINLYDSFSVVFGCFDQSLQLYDLRNPNKGPITTVKDIHKSLITQVKWSPHSRYLLATSSCDRTLRLWDMKMEEDDKTMMKSLSHHVSSMKSQKVDDWVNNLDWNLHEVGLLAFCCQDHLTKAYNIKED